MRTKRNPPIRIEGEGVVLGYDHIVSYMSSNHKVVNMNYQLAGLVSSIAMLTPSQSSIATLGPTQGITTRVP